MRSLIKWSTNEIMKWKIRRAKLLSHSFSQVQAHWLCFLLQAANCKLRFLSLFQFCHFPAILYLQSTTHTFSFSFFSFLSFLLLMPAASHNCGHVFTHCYFSVFLNLICSDLIISVFFMLFFFIKMTRQFLETKPHAVLIQTNLNKKHKQHWQCRKTETKKMFFVLLTLSSKYWPTDVRKINNILFLIASQKW